MSAVEVLIWHSILATGATARLTRLIVFDTYPPAAWVRVQWHRITRDGSWAKLVDCAYCAAPYVAAGILAWGYWTGWQTAWVIVCAWLTVSYLAAIWVRFDGDD